MNKENQTEANVFSENRNWIKNKKDDHWNVWINLKTRLEAQTDKIPDKLYQPIIYQFYVKLKNDEIKSNILMSKLTVLDNETKQIILKEGKTILSGESLFSLNFNKDLNEFFGFTKIQVIILIN
jgi:hypothetical protein